MRTRLRVVGAIVAVACAALGLAHADTTTSVVALRQRFFGAENVDPSTGAVRADRVVLSWFGVTNFAAAIGGHVVLLDAWVPRGEYSGYVPTSPEELAELEPEAIFLGHGHFDHGADVPGIIARSGAKLVGTPEHCDQVRSQVDEGVEVTCVHAVDRETAYGATGEIDDLFAGVQITVIKHVHSASEDPDSSDPHMPATPTPNVEAVLLHPASPADTIHLLQHLGDDEAGTLLYRFRVGNFSLVWHDSSGPLKEEAPGVFDQLRGLRPTDVEAGAIMGFNQVNNGLRDPRLYIEALAPKVFVPTHHDNWLPPVSTRGDNWRPLVEAELGKLEAPPVLRFIGDPHDYVRPEVLTFRVGDPYWD